MRQYIGQKVLITTSGWFVGPDGNDHAAVWGTLKGIYESKAVFGFTPSSKHTNWLLEIGSMLISGCQVNYMCLCPTAPKPSVGSYVVGADDITAVNLPNKILILD